ncbi:sugar transferase [Thalassotalea sp. Y01]|uniref:sugar transferase n=1 Tax=Thalassotalea sp. Y01 TaxID=2729613 RepID=UPI00145FCC9F|nr:sugar transferase [Thalassotalea sp. Y01]NMP16518.1 sugar transferase [Thalassotalea sp. Y01]
MKRTFDLIFSLVGLIFLAPVLLIIGMLVRFNLGSPILFRQKRPGLNGQIFEMIKFRTMTDETDENGCLLSNKYRLTKLGRFLRKSSMDELPELWNVLKGQMSIVGPRPLKVEYLELYNEHQKKRHHVKPGITGWAQINGRNSISWEERFDLDVWYVANQSTLLDLKILILTVLKVIKRDGVEHKVDEVAGRFKGNINSE